jgi:lysophospholipase L1-like esterase
LAVVLSLLFAAGIAEICLRIFGPPYYRFNNLSEEYYTNPRGYHDVIRREGTHIVYGLTYHEDDNGYRLPPPENEGPVLGEAEKQIVAVGDSFTYGRGVRYEDTWPTRLERSLNRDRVRVAIKNCGVVGAGTQDVLEIYELESNELPRESLVIYGMVLNDFGLAMETPVIGLNFIDINNGGYTFNPLRKHSALVNFILHRIDERRLHTATLKAYLGSFDGESAEVGFEFLAQLNQTVSENDETLLVVVFPLLYDFENYHFDPMHQKIEAFCRSRGIHHLDLLPAFSSYGAEDLWANPTDHHPNETAHEIAAEEIHAFIEDRLPEFF